MAGIDDSRHIGVSKRKRTSPKKARSKLPSAKRPRKRKINSAAKGRRGEKEALDLTISRLGFTPYDLRRVVGCERGADIKITSKKAEIEFPFSVEVKNQEKPRFWECVSQAWHNSEKEGRHPLLLFKRAGKASQFIACIDYDLFLTILKRLNDNEDYILNNDSNLYDSTDRE